VSVQAELMSRVRLYSKTYIEIGPHGQHDVIALGLVALDA